MSSQPLTTQATRVIVLAKYTSEAEYMAKQFNMDITNSIFTVISTEAEARALIAPIDTPWVTAGSFHPESYSILVERFGPASTWADALLMRNNEKAIRPEVLAGGKPRDHRL